MKYFIFVFIFFGCSKIGIETTPVKKTIELKRTNDKPFFDHLVFENLELGFIPVSDFYSFTFVVELNDNEFEQTFFPVANWNTGHNDTIGSIGTNIFLIQGSNGYGYFLPLQPNVYKLQLVYMDGSVFNVPLGIENRTRIKAAEIENPITEIHIWILE